MGVGVEVFGHFGRFVICVGMEMVEWVDDVFRVSVGLPSVGVLNDVSVGWNVCDLIEW